MSCLKYMFNAIKIIKITMPFMCKAVSQDTHGCDRAWRSATLNCYYSACSRASIKTVNMWSRNFSNLFRHVLYLKHFHYFLGCFTVTGLNTLARPPQKKHTKTNLKLKNQILPFISVSFTSVKWCHFLWVILLKGLLHSFYVEFYVNVTGLTGNMGTVVKKHLFLKCMFNFMFLIYWCEW